MRVSEKGRGHKGRGPDVAVSFDFGDVSSKQHADLLAVAGTQSTELYRVSMSALCTEEMDHMDLFALAGTRAAATKLGRCMSSL